MTETKELRVEAMRREAEGVLSVELRDPHGAELQPFSAGSHIDLILPNGMTRSYSLLNDPAERHRYVVAVGLDANSRGGSRFVHDRLRVGAAVKVAGPRNNFPLNENAQSHVLIAGGIGITPMLAMMRRLAAADQSFHLYYGVREAARAAFVEDIVALKGGFTQHIDAERGCPMDLVEIIASHPDADFYCCGPGPMLAAFEEATEALPEDRVHLEYFAPKAQDDSASNNAFDVECRTSGIEVHVTEDRTIAEALAEAGVAVELSCQEGICGTCETPVLGGEPDHRDSVLSKAERAANKTMMVCVSRCRGDRLVLDL